MLVTEALHLNLPVLIRNKRSLIRLVIQKTEDNEVHIIDTMSNKVKVGRVASEDGVAVHLDPAWEYFVVEDVLLPMI